MVCLDDVISSSAGEGYKIRGLVLDIFEGLGFLINYTRRSSCRHFRGSISSALQWTHSLCQSASQKKIQSTIKEYTQVIIEEGSIGNTTSSHDWNFLLNNSSHASCPLALQRSSITLTPDPQIRELLLPRGAHSRSTRQSAVVGMPPSQREWSAHSESSTLPSDHHRCSPPGLACPLLKLQIGGSWIKEEMGRHINYLKLRGASLALKSFCSERKAIAVHLRRDSCTATYINHLGGRGTRSPTEGSISAPTFISKV